MAGYGTDVVVLNNFRDSVLFRPMMLGDGHSQAILISKSAVNMLFSDGALYMIPVSPNQMQQK